MGLAGQLIREGFPDVFVECTEERGEECVRVHPEGIAAVARFLREDPRLDFNVLMDLAGVDFPDEEPRFEIVYHFYSLARKARLRVKVRVPEAKPEVDSLTPLWKAANWHEREAWDLFGIRFRGHPNLKRILLYEEFEGHPLRKDYPIRKRQPRIGPLN